MMGIHKASLLRPGNYFKEVSMEEFLMTKSEVCEHLGISISRLKRLEKEGDLQPVRRLLGGKKLYSSLDVDAHMQKIWTGGVRSE